MSSQSVRWLKAGASILAIAALSASCAVGPDFKSPAAPQVGGYTKETPVSRTSSTDAATGLSQRLLQGGRLSQEWWRTFRSPALNALVEQSLNNNPTLQSAIATLRAANQAVYAQEGRFFPFVQANFNPTRQLTAAPISPVLYNGGQPFQSRHPQVAVRTRSTSGPQSAHRRGIQGDGRHQRSQVEAAYLTLAANVAVADQRSLAARPNQRHQSADHDQHQDAGHPARHSRKVTPTATTWRCRKPRSPRTWQPCRR